MKQSLLYLSLIITSIFLNGCANVTEAATPIQTAASIQAPAATNLLDSSVQIILFVPDTQGQANIYTPSRGIGTLTELNGETVILTHNHWYDAFHQMAFMQFRDAGNNLILELDPHQFRTLVVFGNAGTLILNLPAQWPQSKMATLQPANSPLAANTTIQVVYRLSANRDILAVVEGMLISLDSQDGLPVMVVQTANGTIIRPGDSGGGIFINGQLVANMWMNILEGEALENSDMSIAAQMPTAQQLELAQEVGDVAQMVKQNQ